MNLLLSCCLALSAGLFTSVNANTEKAIFVAPALTTLPNATPSLDDLFLESLTADHLSVSLSVPVVFPTGNHPQGLESWYLLRGLNAGQRYEVRICWPAIQPTNFWLDVFKITHVFDTPQLIQSLAAFSEEQTQKRDIKAAPEAQTPASTEESVLFLRISAAADFFAANETLMKHPPPVESELILDPFIANIFPQSLVPTALYIIVLAVGSWFVSGIVWRHLQFTSSTPSKKHTD